MQMNKKDMRRFKSLCALVCPPHIFGDERDGKEQFDNMARNVNNHKNNKHYIKHYAPQLAFLEFVESRGMKYEDFYALWRQEWRRHKERAAEYDKRPVRERKDNKDVINYGTCGSNGNKIRFPKKCRKTAWKRFYKLFPHLKQ